MANVSDGEADRFRRQVVLPEVGTAGQRKIRAARVLLIGSGGLASSAAYYLTAAGVGTIGLVDDDKVDLSNLNRQILHDSSRIGMLKVDSAEKSLRRLDPAVEIHIYPRRLTSSDDVAALLAGYDVVMDCSDNYATRYDINDACIRAGKPWIYGAIFGFEGQVMTVIPGKGACYRCLYPSAPPAPVREVPVIGVTPGVVGTIEAAEALKIILGVGASLVGRLLFVDLLEMTFSNLNVRRNPECPSCRLL